MEKHNYNVDINWRQDRKGIMCSPELADGSTPSSNCIEVATPPEFPKGIPHIWSPEHLFTASVSSCLMTTFLAIAENSKLDFTGFSCKSQGILDIIDGKYAMVEVILKPIITIKAEKDRGRAQRIVQKSEAACLISNSIKSKITMEIEIMVESQ
ncbi:peroxiredoxin-like protein [Ulvibacter sp. MAR_2010_11]|uniref:OsmC family protein n=1 Tax=Ulvibacter sp. MAR_2010_11 TaxID=1250229 RepID=UPI000CB8E75F|nr:OsmC family protein [Ulvibacter sp. MAR_2010_11]PKA84485.1 peroxiredoxin-like protein [Ulvibacter sp. MAR_2010_11]